MILIFSSSFFPPEYRTFHVTFVTHCFENLDYSICGCDAV